MDKNRKRAIVSDIASHFGGAAALSEREAAAYLGSCRNNAREFLSGVGHFKLGAKKMYLAIDIADAIIQATVPGEPVKKKHCPYSAVTEWKGEKP